jgi:PAS domain S-box-containing protein
METLSSEQFSVSTPENGVLALSRSFGVMSLNQAAKQLLGCNPIPGDCWPLDKLFAGVNLSQARAAVRDVLKNGRPQKNITAMMIHATGRTIPCEYSALPLFERTREVIGVILSFRGLPAKSTNSSQQPDRRRLAYMPRLDYRRLVEELPEGMFTIDSRWRITAFNRAAETFTGFTRQEVLGRRCWEIFRSEVCRKNCPMQLAMDRAQPQMDQEVVTLNRKGHRQNLLINIGVLRDGSGKVFGAVETFRPLDQVQPADSVKRGHFDGFIGNSPALQPLLTMLPDVAASEANVLICGESGTGKELVAHTIHSLSKHHDGPFVALNCAALPETLLESELFGHEKGAFTGAERTRPGRFELVGEGTLFLDEIGELRPDLQVKLLRVLEQRIFERVGGTKPIRFRGRIISATNQDLRKLLAVNRFREDLYYRLRTVPLTIPPLRKRQEDIPLLIEHFIEKFNTKTGKRVRSVDPKVMRLFLRCEWSGNVRELERCIEHAFVFVKGPVIFQRHLPDLFEFRPPKSNRGEVLPPGMNPKDKESITWALAQSAGRRQEAAELLGISRTSMWRRMKTYGLL